MYLDIRPWKRVKRFRLTYVRKRIVSPRATEHSSVILPES